MADRPFGAEEWHGVTWIHPLGMAVLAIAALLTLLLPRSYMLWPIVAIGCFVAPAQRIVLLDMDWTVLRLTLLAGLLRCGLLSLKPTNRPKWLSVDTWLVLWLMSGIVIYLIREPSSSSLSYRLGWAFDFFAGYWTARFAIRDWEDIKRLFLGISLISIPVAAAFLNEQMTQHNIFHIFGGVRETTWIREGRLRCQGAYAHPILAGTYWAICLPLIVSQLWAQEHHRRMLACIAASSATIVVMCCASSGPLASVIAASFAGVMVYFRNWLWLIRIGAVFLTIALHFSMKKPVWHLISRIDLVGGSTGWHRYDLFDQWIRNIDDWWLVGTSSTANWSAHPVEDITNQYALESIEGGGLSLIFFLALMASSFRSVGVAARAVDTEVTRHQFAMAWAVGTAVFVHCVSFVSVSYFGQIILLIVLTSAIAASMKELTLAPTEYEEEIECGTAELDECVLDK